MSRRQGRRVRAAFARWLETTAPIPGQRTRRKVTRWLRRADRALGVVAVVVAPPWLTLTLIDLFGDVGETGHTVAAVLFPVVLVAAIGRPVLGEVRGALIPDVPPDEARSPRRRGP